MEPCPWSVSDRRARLRGTRRGFGTGWACSSPGGHRASRTVRAAARESRSGRAPCAARNSCRRGCGAQRPAIASTGACSGCTAHSRERSVSVHTWGSPDRFTRADLDFHGALAAAAGSPLARRARARDRRRTPWKDLAGRGAPALAWDASLTRRAPQRARRDASSRKGTPGSGRRCGRRCSRQGGSAQLGQLSSGPALPYRPCRRSRPCRGRRLRPPRPAARRPRTAPARSPSAFDGGARGPRGRSLPRALYGWTGTYQGRPVGAMREPPAPGASFAIVAEPRSCCAINTGSFG